MVTSVFGSPEGLRGFLGQTSSPPSEEFLNEYINEAMEADPVAIAECAVWWISTNLEPQLGNISVPTLIVAGAKDDIPIDWQRRYANAIKRCRFEAWEYNGHFLPQESPQKLVDLLTSFITKVSNG